MKLLNNMHFLNTTGYKQPAVGSHPLQQAHPSHFINHKITWLCFPAPRTFHN